MTVVTGATGNLGNELCKILQREKVDFAIAGRTNPADVNIEFRYLDLKAMKGINEATKNADTVFHLASSTFKWEYEVDVSGTKLLAEAAKKNGVSHFIFISIVGTDKVNQKYYRMKADAENVLKQSGVNYSILRATQFHELIDRVFAQYFILPVVLFPKHLKIQPIETRTVAEKLYRLSKTGAQNSTFNIGGKEILETREMADEWLKVRKSKKLVINVPTMGSVLKACAEGSLTCNEIADDSITWSEWLNRKYNSQ